jgi:hypothetical protein
MQLNRGVKREVRCLLFWKGPETAGTKRKGSVEPDKVP